MRGWLLVGLAAVAAAAQTNPRNTPEDAAAGSRIYRSHCAECHGLKGEGGRGPDLTRGEYRHGSTDAALLRTISRGVPGTEMPGIYFSENQVWQIVAYVRTLAAGPARVALAGNAGGGRRVYVEKGCPACHRIGGEGGRLGPDLSHVGSMRTPPDLRESILKPDARVSSHFTVAATLKRGEQHSGILMNEDGFSVQLLDRRETLRTLDRREIGKIEINRTKSSMPSYAQFLKPAELDDLVAYLYTLQREARDE
jgi:putative heme-binding domain-containing protein